MKKYMKSSNIKKVVVKCADFWMDEFNIDSDIFDDIYVEAATRAVEKRQNLSDFKVGVIIECWEKKDFLKPAKHICYNTYHVLINAGIHHKAEIMRKNFMTMYGNDLRNESLKGDDGTNDIKQPDSGSIGK